MNRKKTAIRLTRIAAFGFIATAALHSTGIGSIRRLAAQGPAGLQEMMPALWLAFSLDLVVLGMILAAVSTSPGRGARYIVGIAGLCPLGGAVLQMCFLGFVPPTAILLFIAVLTSTAAALNPGRPTDGETGA